MSNPTGDAGSADRAREPFSLDDALPDDVLVAQKIEIIRGVNEEGNFFTWSTDGSNDLTQTLGMLFRAGLDAYMVSMGGSCECECEDVDVPENGCECECHDLVDEEEE